MVPCSSESPEQSERTCERKSSVLNVLFIEGVTVHAGKKLVYMHKNITFIYQFIQNTHLWSHISYSHTNIGQFIFANASWCYFFLFLLLPFLFSSCSKSMFDWTHCVTYYYCYYIFAMNYMSCHATPHEKASTEKKRTRSRQDSRWQRRFIYVTMVFSANARLAIIPFWLQACTDIYLVW